MSELTGRKRFRHKNRWFRRPLLVLQVQIEYEDDGDGDITPVMRRRWRDARVEDFEQPLQRYIESMFEVK